MSSPVLIPKNCRPFIGRCKPDVVLEPLFRDSCQNFTVIVV